MVDRGLACNMREAHALIMANRVRSGHDSEVVVDKPGMMLGADAPLIVKQTKKYVSRGGLKLEGALDEFAVDVTGLRCVDLGASTGGFTDCLLRRGAAQVCAVDVGYGQLAHRLQVDPRVQVWDRTNIRTVDPHSIGAPFDIVVADLSFVGISKVAHDIARFAGKDGVCLLLIKPQFEARKDEVGARGIVTDEAVHARVLKDTIEALGEAGLNTSALTRSPIQGATGNTEFWVRCGSCESASVVPEKLSVLQSMHERSAYT